MTPVHTCCEAVSKTSETFVDFVVIGGRRERVSFEREILWLLQSSCDVSFDHGGKQLRAGSSYNDFYGYLTSIKYAREETIEICQSFNVTQSSSLDVRVLAKAFLYPVVESSESIRENRDARSRGFRRLRYEELPPEWRIAVMDGPDVAYRRLESRGLAEAVIWSSARSIEDNNAVETAFVQDAERALMQHRAVAAA